MNILVDNTWKLSIGLSAYKLTMLRAHSISFNKETFSNIFKNRISEPRIRGVHKQFNDHKTRDLFSSSIVYQEKMF